MTPLPGRQPDVVATEQLSRRLHEVTLRTSLLGADTRVRVLLPDRTATGKRYPVLYLYHGGMDDQTAWTTPGNGDAEAATEGLDLIVVMPDNGPLDYAADWYNDGRFGNPRWETYTFTQLLPWVDTKFPTIGERRGRAAAGVSLGGYSALSYVARRPDLYSAVASFSGQIDTNNPTMQQLVGPFAGGINGSFDQHAVRWRGNNPWDLAANFGGVHISLFCGAGTGEPNVVEGHTLPDLEAMVHEDAVNVAARLSELGIPYHFDDYGPGSHTWDYFRRDLVAWLPHLMEHFASSAAAPSPSSFTYCSIRAGYRVYGWHVELDRPAVEFSAIRVSGAERFEVIGSGRATVVTGPVFEPERPYTLAVREAAESCERTVVADAEGRLSVELRLGPGNTWEQFSTEAAAALGPPAGAPGDAECPFAHGRGSRFTRAAVRVLRSP